MPSRTGYARPVDTPPRTTAELETALRSVLEAPREQGTVKLLLRRPARGERVVLDEAELSVESGLVGDDWEERATATARASGAHLKAQLNVMGARMVQALSDDPTEQAMAGDQLYLDLDVSAENLPVGSLLALGREAVIEVTGKPHTGCAKFAIRFGQEAADFVNTPEGRALRLRGFCARVVTAGTVRTGDVVRRA